jgi:hypothetical protein
LIGAFQSKERRSMSPQLDNLRYITNRTDGYKKEICYNI